MLAAVGRAVARSSLADAEARAWPRHEADLRPAVGADHHVLEHDSAGNRATFWKVRAMPSRAMRCGGTAQQVLAVEGDRALGSPRRAG